MATTDWSLGDSVIIYNPTSGIDSTWSLGDSFILDIFTGASTPVVSVSDSIKNTHQVSLSIINRPSIFEAEKLTEQLGITHVLTIGKYKA